MFTEKKRHFVDGGVDENHPNGKRRCVETSPSIPENYARTAAPHRVSESKSKRAPDKEALYGSPSSATRLEFKSRINGSTIDTPMTKTAVMIDNTPASVIQAKGNSSVSDDDSNKRVQAASNPKIEKKDRKTQLLFRQPTTNKGSNAGNGAYHSSDDDESCSSSSSSSDESSLLSSWSESSEEEGEEKLPSLHVGKEYKGIQRLEKKLTLRKERLKLMCVGRPTAYAQSLEANEEAAGNIRMAEYKENNPDECSSENKDKHDPIDQDKLLSSVCPSMPSFSSSSSATSPASSRLPPNQTRLSWLGMLQFEAIHTLRCSYTVLVVMLVHSAFYGSIDIISKIVYASMKNLISTNTFYSFLLCLGLALLRINGHSFCYTRTTNDYNLVRMEMSNRLKLGIFDARLLKRMKRSASTSSSCNMLGYYFVCLGISNFYDTQLEEFMTLFSCWFDGIWNLATEIGTAEVNEQLPRATNTNLEQLHEMTAPMETAISPTCEVASDLISSPIGKRLYYFWCTDYANEYKSVELVYHGFYLALSIGLAIQVGQNCLTFCD